MIFLIQSKREYPLTSKPPYRKITLKHWRRISCVWTLINNNTHLQFKASVWIRESDEIRSMKPFWPPPAHTHTHTHKHNHTPPFSPAGSLLTHGGLLVWSLWSACRCQSYFLHPASSVQAALAHRQKTHIQVRVSSAHQHPDCSLLNPRRTAHRETGGGVALEPISVRMAKNGIWLFEDVAQRRWITVTSNHKQFAPDATGSPTHDERSDTERKVRALTQRVAVENMGCAAAAKPL